MLYKDEKEYEQAYAKHLKKGTLQKFCPFIGQSCKGVECRFFTYQHQENICLMTHVYKLEADVLEKFAKQLTFTFQ